jgi:hypothetical protein
VEKIKLFAWFLHSQKGMDRFVASDIKGCYRELNLEEPSNIGPFLNDMVNRKPKQALKDVRGYYLEGGLRDEYEDKYGHHEITVQVTQLLSDLPSKFPNVVERDFLNEALICYRHGAFRAAIVMCWNLAYDHLLDYVLTKHLAAFNVRLPIRCPHLAKRGFTAVVTRDDFSEIKESEVIDICRSANIITADVYKILDIKLGRRNTAAHPNTIKILQPQADDFISDLVNNVVLALK